MEYKSENKICQNCKKDFVIEPEDFVFYEKIKVPAPTFCPECRNQRRLSWKNERIFCYRNCNLCNSKIISTYSDKKIVVYCPDCFWSEKWDSSSYGQDYDFSKPFFEQFIELFKKVPQINLNGDLSNKNSDYVNYVVQSNNSYFCFGGGYLENVRFSNLGIRVKDSQELYFSMDCEFCYELLNSNKCYRVCYGNNLKDCMNSYFLQDSVNCNDCIMCCNLRNKTYCYKNEQYTKEEYLKIKDKFLYDLHHNLNSLKKEFKEFLVLHPKKYANILKSEDSTGNNITESSNIANSFNISKTEYCKYSKDIVGPSRNIYDSLGMGLNADNVYEFLTGSLGITNIFSSIVVRNNCMNIIYSFLIRSSSNMFGCISIKKGEYMILNKQYTKEQYEELVPKIIKHMNDMPYIDSKGRIYKYGEFFPSELSPFAYNETTAQEYYPLTKEEALKQGYKWKDKEERNYIIDIYNKDIPDDINDTDESIIGKIIECAHKDCNHQCTEAFKIIEAEYQFYKHMNLPLPRLCPNCRHYERLAQRNPLKLWHRQCMKEGCTNEFETSYAPDRPEIVYCEECYKKEVY